jgi:DNA polymerase/3'-5' exonuclease PolX
VARPGVRNEDVAEVLERIADLLEAQDANPFRVRAYRRAAQTSRGAAEPLARRLERGGRKALRELPGIGETIASQIEEYLHAGRVGMLARLEGQVSPEDLFTTVPGIGDELARRIHDELGIETLEELELAAHDGRLAALRGFGARRARGVRESLAGMLGRSARRRARERRWAEARAREREAQHPLHRAGPPAARGADHPRPSVAALLSFDEEYRKRAEAGELRRIAPRRFNPRGEAWLPVLHGEREGWELTALFSNTARAHELGRTRDWVVVYFERDGEEEQCTVVTEHAGPLSGRRVVRGREAECARHYGERGA